MAEQYLGRLTLTPLFQVVGSTTGNVVRVEIVGPGVTRPKGFGYEYMEVSTDTYILHPRPRVFPWGGPLGTSLGPGQLIKLEVTPGLPRQVFFRSVNQLGVEIDVYAALEIDYFR